MEPSRRTVLTAMAAAGLTGACAAEDTPRAPAAAPGAAAAVCVTTPEAIEGPYYLSRQFVRRDIREGKPGLVLDMALTVVDMRQGCAPVPGTPVEIWHCDAYGYYSGFVEKSPGEPVPPEDGVGDDRTFLRGVQVTGGDGVARFTTILPGWYGDRVTHIHVKIHKGGQVGLVYEGGSTVQTTQILFPDHVIEAAKGREPYSRHGLAPVKLADDMVYGRTDDPDTLVPAMTATADGYTLTMTLGV
ncbi:dioxygenase family protein [Nonomuraea endophytica]|uniref:Protocatechuate 3,4-dioxygenase beta subunit n=1 Tax=Nonomuraea endophytica TaxID=714136 RepID=A0A7W8AEE5_9ACTN|nr:protocatechuate dioxygenase [Nonomuraea endophytica]MBB5084767.1 protocatechuate 3,4-dioxygenase beta subunit [Nonomuraea endophytica]